MKKYGLIFIITGIIFIISSFVIPSKNSNKVNNKASSNEQSKEETVIVKTVCDKKESNNEFKKYTFDQFDNISFDFIDCLIDKDEGYYYESEEKDYTLEFKIAIGEINDIKDEIASLDKSLSIDTSDLNDSKIVIGTSDKKSFLSIISPFRDERLYTITITKEGKLSDKTIKKVIDSFEIKRVDNDFKSNNNW